MDINFRPYLGCISALAYKREIDITNSQNDFPMEKFFAACLDPFYLDTKKIMRSKAFRRLRDKAQVFCLPENPHIRTRQVHTMEVVDIAVTISKILGLNTNLCAAIAWGHDIGHPPFGHIGEEFITKVAQKEFRHNLFGVVVARHIERGGVGMFLTNETEKGIEYHSRGANAPTISKDVLQEYNVMMYSDKIHYTFADINDGLRYKYLSLNKLPKFLNSMGVNQREREVNTIYSLVKESAELGYVSFEKSDFARRFEELRQWMYENFYLQVDREIFNIGLMTTYQLLSDHEHFQGCDPLLLLALLTDKEINRVVELSLRHKLIEISDIRDFGIMEIIPNIKNKKIDIFKI